MSVNKGSNEYEAKLLERVIPGIREELRGFIVVGEASKPVPYIAIDALQRAYFNADARDLMKLRPSSELLISYNPYDDILAVQVITKSTKAKEFLTTVDRKMYASIKGLAMYFELFPTDKGPLYFDYVRKLPNSNIYTYKRRREAD